MKYYLAIDIGASSGRHIVGHMVGGRMVADEVYRFKNGVIDDNGTLVWDADGLLRNVKLGIRAVFKKYGKIESLAIDTWGVDYVLMNGDVQFKTAVSYRDGRGAAAAVKLNKIIPFEELYSLTGIQYQPFNTVYQLFDDMERGRLSSATDFLMMPEYLTFMLTGVRMHEYTNATTTGLVNAVTGEYDGGIISRLGLPAKLFGRIERAGTAAGRLTPEIAAYCGGNCNVLLCASHDTASAVEGIPADGENPYLSSGTWSLLGLKMPKAMTDENSRRTNWSNEGGVGYVRYQKNIAGMWIINNLKRELCPESDFGEIIEAARSSGYGGTVNVNDAVFLAPASMRAAFDGSLSQKPQSVGDYFRCAFTSLAYGYKAALAELSANTGRSFEKLYIVGGGAKNAYLNELVEWICGTEVEAFPTEATAAGNLKIQAEAEKFVERRGVGARHPQP